MVVRTAWSTNGGFCHSRCFVGERILPHNDAMDSDALQALAKRGDKEALKILNDSYFQYGSSAEWAEAVQWFGKYKYKPAIPNLIESLDAASLNLVSAAQWSLEQIFRGPHPKFKSMGEMKSYFERLYEKSRQQRHDRVKINPKRGN